MRELIGYREKGDMVMEKQTMGMTIASLRREQGMTQAELAAKMGVTDKAVSKWERELSCPDIKSLPKLAEILGISVDKLMQAEAPGPEEERKNDRRLHGIVMLVFKAVALAMGIAVTVLSSMGAIDMDTGFTLLGIGLACVGICLLQDGNNGQNKE